MFLHDLKVAYRSLLKYKLQTVISVLSLAIGLSCFAILNTNLRRWLMGDRRLPNVNEIYFLAPETMGGWVKIDRNIYVDICDKFPEIKAVTSVLKTNNLSYLSISKNEEESTEKLKEAFLISDSCFIDVYAFKLLQGNWESIKRQPNAVILTESAAIRILGSTDVLGKTIVGEQTIYQGKNAFRTKVERSYKVVALIADFPRQLYEFKHQDAGVILNSTDPDVIDDLSNERRIFRIHSNVAIKDLNKKIGNYIKSKPELYKDKLETLIFHPILKWNAYWSQGKYLNYPLVLSGVGFLLLLTSIFNYVLFMSGRILNRQKEYGIRQINGANTNFIFRMFVMEISLSICMVILISFVLMELLATIFVVEIDGLVHTEEGVNLLLLWGGNLLEYAFFTWLGMLGVCWFILRRFRMLTTLQHIYGGGVRYKNRLTNVLLGLQLVICISLGGGTSFVYTQQEFLEERYRGKLTEEECERIYEEGLGFTESFRYDIDPFKFAKINYQNMITESPYVEATCRSYGNLYSPSKSTTEWKIDGIKNEIEEGTDFHLTRFFVGGDYPKMINVKMEEGRFFKEGETQCAVVNREFIRRWKVNPLGKPITIKTRLANLNYSDWQNFHIIGIIEDITSLFDDSELTPRIYLPFPQDALISIFSIKLLPGANPDFLKPLKEKLYEQIDRTMPIELCSLEERIDGNVKEVQKMSVLISLFASLCIIICLLGIYSSMMLAVEKRGREMAIRKINGARLVDIARIFVRHYFVLLGIAALIAFPALYLGVLTWLENYTYRVPITIFPFIAIFVLLFAIVLLTIGSQLIKIMRVNPVEKLKSE